MIKLINFIFGEIYTNTDFNASNTSQKRTNTRPCLPLCYITFLLTHSLLKTLVAEVLKD